MKRFASLALLISLTGCASLNRCPRVSLSTFVAAASHVSLVESLTTEIP